MVTVDRETAITAAGACKLAAEAMRRQSRRRTNAGPHMASHRQWLRDLAQSYEDAGKTLQTLADESL